VKRPCSPQLMVGADYGLIVVGMRCTQRRQYTRDGLAVVRAYRPELLQTLQLHWSLRSLLKVQNLHELAYNFNSFLVDYIMSKL